MAAAASPSPPAPVAWEALPLVVVGADGRLRVPDSTRACFRAATAAAAATVHVLGIFGPAHTGKRLLLRELLHAPASALAADPAGSASDATEAGERVLLWVWRHPGDDARPDVERLRFVLTAPSDPEDGGPNNDNPHAQRDRRHRIALLLLLCSALLYNEDGEINASALDRLAWAQDVAASLRIKPNQDDAGVGTDFAQHAPKLVWVIRNSKVKWLTDPETGDKISATAYVDRCLADEPGFSEAVLARNTRRMYVNQLFRQREGVALSRAVEVGATCDFSTPRESLRGQFVESIDKLFNSILSDRAAMQNHLPAKTIMGRAVHPDQLATALDTYVTAINNNALPTIQTAHTAIIQRMVHQRFDVARDSFEGVIGEVTGVIDSNVRSVSARQLLATYRNGLQVALAHVQNLQASLPEHVKKTVYQDAMRAFQSETEKRIKVLVEANDALSRTHCQKLVEELLPSNLEILAATLESRSRESFSDGLVTLLTQYKSDLRNAVDAYRDDAAGPAADGILEAYLLATVFESIKAWGASVLRQYQQHIRTLLDEHKQCEHELDVVRSQDTNSAFSTDDHKRLYEEQLEQSTEQLSELRRVLLGELNDKKSELDRLMNDMSTMELKHDARVKNIESDLAWVRSRTAELEKAAAEERQRLEVDVSGATEEILTKERSFHLEERSLLAQQKELLARVVELEREVVQKKTKHVQQVFVIESDISRRVDELKSEQVEFARQLKSQAKTDTGVLKLAYQKKKNVVQNEIDRVQREIKEFEEKLKAFDNTNAKTPMPVASSASRTSSRDFLKLGLNEPTTTSKPAGSDGTAAASSTSIQSVAPSRPTTTRSDTDMCKTQ